MTFSLDYDSYLEDHLDVLNSHDENKFDMLSFEKHFFLLYHFKEMRNRNYISVIRVRSRDIYDALSIVQLQKKPKKNKTSSSIL